VSHNRLIVALSIAAMVGCSNTEPHSVKDRPHHLTAATAKTSAPERETPRTMAQEDSKPWRSDPVLSGRFHREYPDDLQVIIHDGGPRFTDKPPELVWVTVSGKHAKAYRGKVLNQPHGVTSVAQGDEILFLAVAGAEHPFQVSEKYLAERDNWIIKPCGKCGFAELFDAPSDLLKKVFPNVGKNSNEEMEAFTSFCPMCRGVQVIHKPGLESE
jgi:hypothetical protein